MLRQRADTEGHSRTAGINLSMELKRNQERNTRLQKKRRAQVCVWIFIRQLHCVSCYIRRLPLTQRIVGIVLVKFSLWITHPGARRQLPDCIIQMKTLNEGRTWRIIRAFVPVCEFNLAMCPLRRIEPGWRGLRLSVCFWGRRASLCFELAL